MQKCRHTELDGEFFPFSRGCSFYKLNSEGKIVWARDCVEASPPKPGDGAIAGLKLLVPVMKSIGPKNADPANLTTLPLESNAVWLFYAGQCHSKIDDMQIASVDTSKSVMIKDSLARITFPRL